MTIALERVEASGDDSQRCSQLMRRVGGEAALHQKSLLQPLKGLIDGDDERERLGRHIRLRQAQRDRGRPDRARLRRGPPQR